MSAVLTASIPAIAVAAVVAAGAAGAWLVSGQVAPGRDPSAAGREGPRLPHMAVGALAGVAALIAARWSRLPVPVLVAAASAVTVVAAVAAGWLDGLLERRRRDVHHTPLPPLLADLGVLALVIAVATALRPAFAVEFAAGPLGGSPAVVPALVAVVLGVAGVFALSSDGAARLPTAARWALVGAALALAAFPAAGLLNAARLDPSKIGVPSGVAAGAADPFGLAVRAFAVALAAGHRPGRILLWAAAMAGAEAALRRVDPAFVIFPVIAVLVAGVWSKVATARIAPNDA